MLLAGVLGLVLAAFHRSYKNKGSDAPNLKRLSVAGRSRLFHPKYGLAFEIVLALVLVIITLVLAEKNVHAQPLAADTHTFQSGPGEPPYGCTCGFPRMAPAFSSSMRHVLH